MSTPSEELAMQVHAALVAAKLVTTDDAGISIARLADGTVTAADWRLAVDKAHSPKGRQ